MLTGMRLGSKCPGSVNRGAGSLDSKSLNVRAMKFHDLNGDILPSLSVSMDFLATIVLLIRPNREVDSSTS
jgi:hypothetical protein